MRQTLLYIPETLFGLPLFGWGMGLGLLIAVVVFVHCYQYVRHRKIGDVGGSLALLGIGGVMLVFIVPNLIEPGRGVPIRGYGVCLLLAILAAFSLMLLLGKRQGIATEKIYSLGFWAVVAGIMGARIFYVTEYWQDTFLDPSGRILPFGDLLFRFLNFAQGGLVVFGSILGGALGAYIFMRRNGLPVLRTFDILAPAMALGSAIGRIGCLLNGCCFGNVTDVSWGIVFPVGSPAHVRQVAHGDVFLYGLKFAEDNNGHRMFVIAEVLRDCEADACGLKPKMRLRGIPIDFEGNAVLWEPATLRAVAAELVRTQMLMPDKKIRLDFFTDESYTKATPFWLDPTPSEVLPVHPTQIYSSVLALLLCGTLLFLGRLQLFQRRAGLVFAMFMILYSVGRFCIEIIRTDEDSFFGTGLTVSQNVCIAVCLVGIVLFVYAYRLRVGNEKKNVHAE